MKDIDNNKEEKDSIEMLKQVILLQQKQINWLKAIAGIIILVFLASRYFR